MEEKTPKVSIDILVIKDNKILLGLLSKDWLYNGKQVYGLPGREIKFRESIGDAVKRNIEEEINCKVVKYTVFSVNANYAFDNHYIGIGVIVEISGEVKLLKPKDWDSWEWFDKSDIPKNLFPAAENIIRSYLENKVTVSE
jgi:ADP-ribose pyrophosphatase YjhB (NUDIX family)